LSPDLAGVSNAIAAAGVDYVDAASGRVAASVFGAHTANAVYEHDHPVCARVQNYQRGLSLLYTAEELIAPALPDGRASEAVSEPRA